MPKLTPETAMKLPRTDGLSATTVIVSALLTALPTIVTGSRLIEDPTERGLLNPESAMRLVRHQDVLLPATVTLAAGGLSASCAGAQ